MCVCVCVCLLCIGTHGNGLKFGSLATLVTRLEFVNGKGEVLNHGINLLTFVQFTFVFMMTSSSVSLQLVSASGDSNPELFKAAQVRASIVFVQF